MLVQMLTQLCCNLMNLYSEQNLTLQTTTINYCIVPCMIDITMLGDTEQYYHHRAIPYLAYTDR